MEYTQEEQNFILKRREEAVLKDAPEPSRETVEEWILVVESMSVCRNGGRSMLERMARIASAWGFAEGRKK